jgi:predicted enzyme related to lactoylglutathione lyase
MAERTKHDHGTPSWVDLATSDVAAARRFYGELFGWDFEEEPTDAEGVTYTMARRNGKAAAAIAPAQPGRPSAWQTYVTVDDVDATTAKVGPAGGMVFMEPFEVMEFGRMAVIADPTGGALCLWQPRRHIGSEIVNEHGALCWTELLTPDVDAAVKFFGEVLGWTTRTMSMGAGDYTIFNVGERGVAGAVKPPQAGIPPHWAVYFAIDDCDKGVATAKELGGSVVAEPFDAAGIGRMALLRDDQGIGVNLIQLEQPGT